MTAKKPRLELTWIGKEERPRLEPRILVEDPELSYQAPRRVTENDIFDNLLIHGDNLLALKALEQEYAGKVKCVFIDPPYNTGSAFEQYDDGLEHSIWLSLMRDRLELLRELLRDDGSIWITIDDNEAHYLKVLCDEVFGRPNFVANFVWQKTLTRRNDARLISVAHDHVLVFAKSIERVTIERLGTDSKRRATYTNRDNDPRGDWLAVPFHAPNVRTNLMYAITTPGGRTLHPPEGRHWSTTEEKFRELVADNRIYFGRDGNGMAQRKKFWSEADESQVAWTWWPYEETGENREANREAKEIAEVARVKPFSTPKPERLLHRILQLATRPGDLVLDSFGGSGTTGAVAHKMGRRWIMVEVGDHAATHCVPRLRMVADGADPGGVTDQAGWTGGGGFRFMRLAPSLLEKDTWGNWIVNKKYRPEMLAEAMCKLEGFRYAPAPEVFWNHGRSTERDFIYVTTQNLGREQLQQISDQVGPERSLLICCAAFRAKRDEFPNLTLKKIPLAVLSRCEWGRDDYSLNVDDQAPVQAVEEAKAEAVSTAGGPARKGGRRKKPAAMQDLPLFASLDAGSSKGDRS